MQQQTTTNQVFSQTFQRWQPYCYRMQRGCRYADCFGCNCYFLPKARGGCCSWQHRYISPAFVFLKFWNGWHYFTICAQEQKKTWLTSGMFFCHLNKTVANSFLLIHAWRRCDTTSSVFNQGKTAILNLIKKKVLKPYTFVKFLATPRQYKKTFVKL